MVFTSDLNWALGVFNRAIDLFDLLIYNTIKWNGHGLVDNRCDGNNFVGRMIYGAGEWENRG